MSSPNSPLLSIITVCYNAKATIEQTILNILHHGFVNYEYLIIDGDSTDGTLEVLRKYHDKITYWVSEPDKGIYEAMNKGIQMAKGDWVIFMNSGDFFYANKPQVSLEHFFNQQGIKNHAIVYGDTFTKNEKRIIHIPTQKVTSDFFFQDTLCHQCVFFNKKVFEEVGIYNLKYKIIADRELLYRIAKAGGTFFYINAVICVWDEEGFSKANIPLIKMEELLFIKQNFNFFKRNYLILRRKLKSGIKKIVK